MESTNKQPLTILNKPVMVSKDVFEQHGHEVLPLQLNVSTSTFTPTGEETLRISFNICQNCDDYVEFDFTDAYPGKNYEALTACPVARDATYKVQLNVPSGKIVIADDLRRTFGRPNGNASLNSIVGRQKHAAEFAEMGVAYGCVLNTSPSVFLAPDENTPGQQKIVVASLDYDYETGEEIVPGGWNKIGEVITDLWAYSIADHDHYLQKEDENSRSENPPKGRVVKVDIAEVPVGVWEFTHYADQPDFDDESPGAIIYAEARLL